MAFVIAEPCIDVKDRSCIDVCPVDCIYEVDEATGELTTPDGNRHPARPGTDLRMLYIHPDECIDCGACEPVCPVQAILSEYDLPAEWTEYKEKNREGFADLA